MYIRKPIAHEISSLVNWRLLKDDKCFQCIFSPFHIKRLVLFFFDSLLVASDLCVISSLFCDRKREPSHFLAESCERSELIHLWSRLVQK